MTDFARQSILSRSMVHISVTRLIFSSLAELLYNFDLIILCKTFKLSSSGEMKSAFIWLVKLAINPFSRISANCVVL